MKKPLTSHRKPKLRVVGTARTHTRRATTWQVLNVPVVAEFWTQDEWDALPDWERHHNARRVPGGGWMLVRHPIDEDEINDLHDLYEQVEYQAKLIAGEV